MFVCPHRVSLLGFYEISVLEASAVVLVNDPLLVLIFGTPSYFRPVGAAVIDHSQTLSGNVVAEAPLVRRVGPGAGVGTVHHSHAHPVGLEHTHTQVVSHPEAATE